MVAVPQLFLRLSPPLLLLTPLPPAPPLLLLWLLQNLLHSRFACTALAAVEDVANPACNCLATQISAAGADATVTAAGDDAGSETLRFLLFSLPRLLTAGAVATVAATGADAGSTNLAHPVVQLASLADCWC